MQTANAKILLSKQKETPVKRQRPNIELLTQKAIKALNFQNSNAEYVDHMEKLKL